MTPTETKLGSPQLFLVSSCAGANSAASLIQAATWQEAVFYLLRDMYPDVLNNPDFVSGFMLTTVGDNTGILPDFIRTYPTIRSMKSALWATSLLSMSIGIIRPAVAAIDTGYLPSDDGPLSATTVKVAVEHMSLYDDVVYVP